MNQVLSISLHLFTSSFFWPSCIGNNTSYKRACTIGERLSFNICEPLPVRDLKEYEDTIWSDPFEVVVKVKS